MIREREFSERAQRAITGQKKGHEVGKLIKSYKAKEREKEHLSEAKVTENESEQLSEEKVGNFSKS